MVCRGWKYSRWSVTSSLPGSRTSAPWLSSVQGSSSEMRSPGLRSRPRSKRRPASACAMVACVCQGGGGGRRSRRV